MHRFLLNQYRPWSALVGGCDTVDNFQGPFIDNQLGSPGKCSIGFDYEPIMGPEREYHFAIVRWIAIQIGKRRSAFRSEGLRLSFPVPYVVLDGSEVLPILLQAPWDENTLHASSHVCDPLGMRVDDHFVREFAWYCLPPDVFDRLAGALYGKTPGAIRKALIQEGLPKAKEILGGIRAQITRIDVLWHEIEARPVA